jgi:hypothetical protein
MTSDNSDKNYVKIEGDVVYSNDELKITKIGNSWFGLIPMPAIDVITSRHNCEPNEIGKHLEPGLTVIVPHGLSAVWGSAFIIKFGGKKEDG